MSTARNVYRADLASVPEMMRAVEDSLTGKPEKFAYSMKLICEEILVNIVSYAYPEMETGELTINWYDDTENQRLTIVFEDSGAPFNPLLKESPDLSVPMAERKIGGLGIMMVRELSDAVRYAYENGKNILTVEKNYGD
ncbi:MAG: ATP-binding protein [Clostridiales bacterium]|nr:ATP-binding protein [Clostridiales bacterium]